MGPFQDDAFQTPLAFQTEGVAYTIDDRPSVSLSGFDSVTIHGSGSQLFIISDYKDTGS